MSISQAVAQVRDAMLGGSTPTAAVAEAAHDFALHPALVLRKFQEQHDATPAGWLVLEKARKANLTRMGANAARNATQVAQQAAQAAPVEAGKYILPEWQQGLVGAEFEVAGGRYFFVAYVSTNGKRRLVATRATDKGVVHWKLSSRHCNWVDRLMGKLALGTVASL